MLYDLVGRGQWPLAAGATVASIVAAIYAIRLIQAVCFAPAQDGHRPAPLAWASPVGLIALLLAALTAAVNFFPEPVAAVAATLFAVKGHMPHVEGPWPWLATVPYVGAFALYFLGHVSRNSRDVAAVALAGATLTLALLTEGLDPLSRLFALLFAGVIFLVALYSTAYIRHEGGERHYHFFLFLMAGSLMGVATATDLGSFYLFWELMTWSSYLLIVQSRSAEALQAGAKYFIMCAGGAYLMLLGVIGVGVAAGGFAFADLAAGLSGIDPVTGMALIACFLVGFGVKAGFVPLHGWLPVAHPAAPSSVSAPLSSILTKTGFYGLLKVLFAGFGLALWHGIGGSIDFALVLTVVGVVTLLYGEVMAWRQRDIKRLFAYSTIAQVGEIAALLGIGTSLALAGASAHILAHGLMKTLLFLAAGALVMRAGSRQIADLAGLARRMPLTALTMALGLLAIMGLPPFAGFVSKFLMIYAAVKAGAWPVAAALLMGGVIGVLYYGRLLRTICFDPLPAERAAVHEAPPAMLAPLLLLAGALLLFGLWPAPLLGLAQDAAAAVAAARGVGAVPLPTLAADWPWAALIAAVGGVATLTLGRAGRVTAGALAVGTMALAFVAVLAEPGRYTALPFAFALVVAGIGALNLLYSIGYFAHHGHRPERFFGMVALMLAGLLGMAGSRELFGFFFFWEIMSSWTLWFAIAHEETPEALTEAFKYFVFNMAGASFLFLGVALLAAGAGSFELSALKQGASSDGFALGLGLALLGFAMKAAMFTVRVDYQMHPATAPTPVSGYISAVLLKSGPLYAFLFLAWAGVRDGGFGYALAVLGAVTAIYAGLMAFIQTGIKRLLIYSTVSQLGYVMCGLALGDALSTAGGLFHAFNHVFLKNTLFLAAGAILAQQHIVSLDQLGGAGRRMPWTFAFFAFCGLSLAGLPPLNGLASKWLIYEGALTGGHPFIALALMGASLTTLAATLKFIHATFMGAESPAAAQLHEAPVSMRLPMLLMSAATLALSFLPGLALVPIAHIQAQLGLPAISADWLGPLPGSWGWHPLSLWLPLAALFGVGWLLMRAGRPQVTLTHAHTCGVDLAPAAMRVTASHLYSSPGRLVKKLLFVKENAA